MQTLKEKLKVNQRIQLNITEGEYKGNYYSKVADEVDDGIVVVGAPVEKSSLVPVALGERINMLFWDSTAQYAFEARVIDRRMGSMPTITIEKCSEIQRMQRRSYFRVQARISVVFSIKGDGAGRAGESEDGDEEAVPRRYEGTTLNISGGGILLSADTELNAGDVLELELCLSEQEHVIATGRIERVEYLSTRKIYHAGIVFVMIYENDRDKIIAFVFKKEIELRRKGLL